MNNVSIKFSGNGFFLLIMAGCVGHLSTQSKYDAGLPYSGQEVSVQPGINDRYMKDIKVEEWVNNFEIESREIYKLRFRILDELHIKSGMVVADVGAGTGLFENLFAEVVGADGLVIAVDLVPEFLQLIRERAQQAGHSNIQTVLCDEDDVLLADQSVDLIFVCDTYHHFEYPRSTLKSMYDALKPGGEMILLDFIRKPGKSRAWVLGHVRAGEITFTAEILSAGFVLAKQQPDDTFLTENYMVRFTKPAQ